MSVVAAIRQMISAGLTVEQALVAAEAVEATMPKQRTAGAIRQERYRRNKASQASHVTESDACDEGDASLTPSPIKEKNQKKINPTPAPTGDISPARKAADLEAEFAEFWGIFPRKVGKGQAEKAFRASRKVAVHQEILAGAHRYAAERQGEDPNFTKHPATWLNAKGWLDEPSPPQRHGPKLVHSAPRKSGSDLMIDTTNEMLREMRGENPDDWRAHTGGTIDVRANSRH